MLQQFGRFDHQRHRQIFRRMELVPVALVRKCAQPVTQHLQFRRGACFLHVSAEELAP